MILLLAPPSSEREELAAFLSERGHLLSAMEPSGAQPAKVARSGVETIVLDLASADAMKFLKRYGAQPRRVPVICLADRRKPEPSSDALRLGAFDIVARPLRMEDVAAAIANAREMDRLPESKDVEPPVAETIADGVFGVSPAMRDVLGLVERLATSRCAVLIVGERGTGREMVARTIHALGPRRERPFVKVACAAASIVELASLLERAAADEATVYLENLSELSPDLQARLAARLQACRQSSNPEPLNPEPVKREPVRFITGTQPRLFEWVERGTVRRDLVEALSIVRIDLPPLRQRPEDVPLLAGHFLKEACRQHLTPAKTFTASVLLLLAALPWRGNAAELRALCERLAVLVPRGVILLEDVLAHVRFDAAEAIGRPEETLRVARERFERDYVTAVLQQQRGRLGETARQLGIERTNLYRKMKQLKIQRSGQLV